MQQIHAIIREADYFKGVWPINKRVAMPGYRRIVGAMFRSKHIIAFYVERLAPRHVAIKKCTQNFDEFQNSEGYLLNEMSNT